MYRRTFAKGAALCAVAVSASSFIRFDGRRYVADCESTSDILGPFYRPNSPVRNSLVVPGAPGDNVELRGIIYHKDCVTPYKHAKVELWHCSAEGVYDNSSDDFLYRGTAFSDHEGRYFFNTVMPVPYDIGDGDFRPAHFHMMFTAEGYVPLVTQLYFTGDPYLDNDESSSSPNAKRRILDVQSHQPGLKRVEYNVGMSNTLLAEPSALDALTGIYVDEKDMANQVEFFKNNNSLWIKNELFGENLDYAGKNIFLSGGVPAGTGGTFTFKVLKKGLVNLNVKYTYTGGKKVEENFVKTSR